MLLHPFPTRREKHPTESVIMNFALVHGCYSNRSIADFLREGARGRVGGGGGGRGGGAGGGGGMGGLEVPGERQLVAQSIRTRVLVLLRSTSTWF